MASESMQLLSECFCKVFVGNGDKKGRRCFSFQSAVTLAILKLGKVSF